MIHCNLHCIYTEVRAIRMTRLAHSCSPIITISLQLRRYLTQNSYSMESEPFRRCVNVLVRKTEYKSHKACTNQKDMYSYQTLQPVQLVRTPIAAKMFMCYYTYLVHTLRTTLTYSSIITTWYLWIKEKQTNII